MAVTRFARACAVLRAHSSEAPRAAEVRLSSDPQRLALFLLPPAAMRSSRFANRPCSPHLFCRHTPLAVVCVSAALAACEGESAMPDPTQAEGEQVQVEHSSLLNVNSEFLPYRVRSNWTGSGFTGTFGTFLADVTGDGKADAISLNAGSLIVRRASSTGSSFNASEIWSTTPF